MYTKLLQVATFDRHAARDYVINSTFRRFFRVFGKTAGYGDNKMQSTSFRDPSGFVFRHSDGKIYRQVNKRYAAEYDLLMNSGLYRELADAGMLISHEEIGLFDECTDQAYKLLLPEQIPFISYPYEWCFSQLKDAALVTLDIQKKAINHGMSLKDASAYNIQFSGEAPVFIDTLSFEKYQEGKPWVAYRQFCRHFLAPLVLASRVDIRLLAMSRAHIDGIPLDLASRLVPFASRFRPGIAMHLVMHAKSQARYADSTREKPKAVERGMSRMAMTGLIDSLESTVKGLKWEPSGTEWADYTESCNYSDDSLQAKKKIVREFLDRVKPAVVWDLGANTGVFSRLAAVGNTRVMAFDIDMSCVEMNYLSCRKEKRSNLVPLFTDLSNPGPSLGWAHEERDSMVRRGPADAAMALALMHHLAIGNNVPFSNLARFFASLGRTLIIEWVPKSDPQVKRLLRGREDIFDDYTKEKFEKAFGSLFVLDDSKPVADTGRVMYLMSVKG